MKKEFLFLGWILMGTWGSLMGQNPCTLPNRSERVGSFAHGEALVFEQDSFFLWTQNRIFSAYHKKGTAWELVLQDTLEVAYKEPLTEGNRMILERERDGRLEVLVEVAFWENDPNYSTSEMSFYFKVFRFEKRKGNFQLAKGSELVVRDLKIVPPDSVDFFWKQREYQAYYPQKKIGMSPEFLNQFQEEPQSRRTLAMGGMVIVVLMIAYALQAWQTLGWVAFFSLLIGFAFSGDEKVREHQALLKNPVHALATIDYYKSGGGKSTADAGWVYHFNYKGRRKTNKVKHSPLPNPCMSPGSQFPVWFEQEHPYNAAIDWWKGNCP